MLDNQQINMVCPVRRFEMITPELYKSQIECKKAQIDLDSLHEDNHHKGVYIILFLFG